MSEEETTDLPAFDRLWNYNDPAGTEAAFREILPRARGAQDQGYLTELLTQIARTQGLQQKYADAHATLDEADALIEPDMQTARARSLLERGRVHNSSGHPEKALPFFEQALQTAQAAGLEFYAVDAAHMLGIAAEADHSLQWNEEAIRLAEAAEDPRARGWLGPLYNNTGWTYHDMGRHQEALHMFERHLAFRKAQNNAMQTSIARWSIAKMLRFLGVEEALEIQRELLELPERNGNYAEGYTHEEIGECLLLLGRQDEAAPQFALAWELLHEEPWLRQDEPERLERLKRLGGI